MSPRALVGLALLVLAGSAMAVGVASDWSSFAEDAWIHLHYAEMVGHGQGLVGWPGGPTEEGYSSLNWVLLMAIPSALGLDVVSIARASGVVALLLSVVWMSWLAHRALHTPGTPGAALPHRIPLLLTAGIIAFGAGAQRDVTVWASAGLSTIEYCLALVALAATASAAWNKPDTRHLVLLALVGFLVANQRPEGPLHALLAFAAIAAPTVRGGAAPRRAWLVGFALLMTLGGVLAAWKLWYFGSIWSNPAWVKLSVREWLDPWAYISRFFLDQGWAFVVGILALPFAWISAVRARAPGYGLLTVLVVLTGAQLFFCWYSGGDYMARHRFLVPTLPLLAGAAAVIAGRGTWLAMITAALLVSGTVGSWIEVSSESAGSYTSGIAAQAARTPQQRVCERLEARFADDPGFSFATSEFGYIPFHTRARAHDILGLNDKRIARTRGSLPIAEAAAAAADWSMALSPDVFVVYGLSWKDGRPAADAFTPETVALDPNVWFLVPYVDSAPFRARWNLLDAIPDQPTDEFLWIEARADAPPLLADLDPLSSPSRLQLLRGFAFEPDKTWAGPLARLLVVPEQGDGQIVVSGWAPPASSYPDGRFLVEAFGQGAAIGDRRLASFESSDGGLFELVLPRDAFPHAGGAALITIRGSRLIAATDARALSWVLRSVECRPGPTD